MENMTRFGISIEDELLDKFEEYMRRRGYSNRSEAIRDVIRDTLVAEEWEGGESESIGAVSLVYNHESRELAKKLTSFQHDSIGNIVASLHVHVDRHNCLEVLVLHGHGRDIKQLGATLISTKGVKHGKMTFTTLGAIV